MSDKSTEKSPRKSLKKLRVAVLAVDGFEQVEVTIPVAALRRAGADVRLISLRPGRIRGMNFIWPGGKLPVDDTVANARVEDYGALLLPGGFVSPDLLRQSEKARQFVQAFEQTGRPIATLCHGAEVLISAGLVRGRRLACWPGIADDVRNAGGTFIDESLVRDDNWVSSRSPLDLAAFIPAMLDLFAERAPATQTKLKRQLRWATVLSRAVTWGAVPLAIAATRGARRTGWRARRGQTSNGLVYAAVGLVGLTALGKLVGRRPPRLSPLVSKGYRQSVNGDANLGQHGRALGPAAEPLAEAQPAT